MPVAGRRRQRCAVLVVIMSGLLYTLLGVTYAVQQCAVYREIAPCTCKQESRRISVNCMQMDSFGQVVTLLQNKFHPKDSIQLRIGESNLSDLGERTFKELNMTIEDLKLNSNEISELSPYTFSGLQHVSYMSLADNPIPYMPVEVFEMMPKIKTLDIGRLRLKNVPEESFRSLPDLETLVLPGNKLYRIDTHAIPATTIRLHLAKNSIKDLNGSLRHLSELQWLFLTGNELASLDGELPVSGMKIKMVHAGSNHLTNVPMELKTYANLENLFLQNNFITALDGVLSKSRKLQSLHLENNHISTLTPDDFAEAENLQWIELHSNFITNLNGSMLPLKKLYYLNLTHNLLSEFSWHEVRTLKELRHLDLSFNRISHLSGMTPNMVEWESKLTNLRLNNNHLHTLNGALSGLRSLVRLNLSSNSLTHISPDDLIGLDQLSMLDISHNQLTTLNETRKTFLPALEELIASHNLLTVLDKDFHGLPVLCWADLSNNQITALGRDLVSKTHCRIRDGMHEENFGTLRIYLKDNPVLCDVALPELISSFELNHTKIVGVAHCPPLSEQPVTTKQNGFWGYLPSDLTTLPTPIEIQNEPLYKVEASANNNLQDLNYPVIRPDQFVPLRHGKHAHKMDSPMPYQRIISQPPSQQQQVSDIAEPPPVLNENSPRSGDFLAGNSDSQKVPITNTVFEVAPDIHNETLLSNTGIMVTELPLKDQAIYTNVDPQVQQRQISELASELQQLRNRVQKLQTENERLTQNIRNFPLGDNASNAKREDIETNYPRLVYEDLPPVVMRLHSSEVKDEKAIPENPTHNQEIQVNIQADQAAPNTEAEELVYK